MPYLTSFDGVRIHYEITGRGKRPLFFIMGLGMDKRGWMFQVPYFSEEFLVFLMDNRGIGKSDIPQGFFTTEDMARDIYELMRKEGIERASLVGASMGGMILQKFASRYKDMVEKLVLVCTLHKVDEHEGGLIREGLKLIKNIDIDQVDEAFLKQYLDYLTDTEPERIISYLLENLLSQETLEKNKDFVIDFFSDYIKNGFNVKGFLKQLNAVLTHDSTEDLREIRAETLVITGDEDKIVPPWKSEFIAKNIPSATLKIIKGGSHAVNFEKFDEFNRIVRDFLIS